MSLDSLFAQLEVPKHISQTVCPKIQMVPHFLRDRQHFAKYYLPRMISFGPIHHGEPRLRLGEQLKLTWASMYLRHRNKSVQYLHQKIVENIRDLKDRYSEDAVRHFDDENLASILLVDGCCLLQILKNYEYFLGLQTPSMAPVFQDILLLENQLPLQLLNLLSNYVAAIPNRTIQLFGYQIPIDMPTSPHLLDLWRRMLLFDSPTCQSIDELGQPAVPRFYVDPSWTLLDQFVQTRVIYRNIKELKELGIRVKRSRSGPLTGATSFNSGWFLGNLIIPGIFLDNAQASILLNLAAYEMCLDFQNELEINSFLEFMGSLIQSADDVKELRSAGILRNALGSDNDVAEFFNLIRANVVPNPATVYSNVRVEIERHCLKKYKIWIAQIYNHAYFSTSASFIAFLAASLALILTFLQTWFTIDNSMK